MGASFFTTTYRGKSLNDAYKSAVEEAESEHGHDPYNGTIATTAAYGVMDRTKEYKASGKSLNDYIDSQINKLSKRQCAAICVEEPKDNNNKVKSQVEHIVIPGTKKWVLKYVVYNHHNNELGSFDTKGDAVEFARKRTEKTQQTTIIEIKKVLDGKINPRVAKISYKRSSTEKDGKWIFFGWAAE
jgi:hypothetical protein